MAVKKKDQEEQGGKKAAVAEAKSNKGVDKKDTKTKEAKKEKKGAEGGMMQQVKSGQQFLREVYIEFQKITWPERAQVIRETWSVLFLVAVITLLVLGFDMVVAYAISKLQGLFEWAHQSIGGTGVH